MILHSIKVEYDIVGLSGKGRWAVTVYIEQILIANFLTDGALLWMTGRLWGRSMVRWRWTAASLAAALWAVAATLPALAFLGAPWFWGAGLAGMTALCYMPCRWRDFLRLWITLCGSTFIAGGAAMALCARISAPYAYACTPLGMVALAVTAHYVLPGWRNGLRRFTAVIGCPGGQEFPAIIDSGNSLFEPLSGLPVIVTGEEAARALLGDALNNIEGIARWIPCKTAVGGKVLPALRSGNIRIKLDGAWKQCGPVYIAVTEYELPGGVAALIPPLPDLMGNGRNKWYHCA